MTPDDLRQLEQDYDDLEKALAVVKRLWPDGDRIEEIEAWLRELAQDRLVLMEMADART